jgi:hypothetical protein
MNELIKKYKAEIELCTEEKSHCPYIIAARLDERIIVLNMVVTDLKKLKIYNGLA